jgi:nitrogen fixation/metabolism regulation signal transduction histidine kinase
MMIIGGAASLIIATLMAVLLTRGIAGPITSMTSAMTTLAEGDIEWSKPFRLGRSSGGYLNGSTTSAWA